jgi:hypothetical protein
MCNWPINKIRGSPNPAISQAFHFLHFCLGVRLVVSRSSFVYCERSTNESMIPLSVFISVRPNLVQLDLAAINKLTSAILVSRSLDLLGFGFFSLLVPSLCSFDRF